MPQANIARKSPFELDINFKNPLRRLLFKMIKNPLERILRLRTLQAMYREVDPSWDPPYFTNMALDMLDVDYDVAENDCRRIPDTGPVIVVANHPFGAIEGMLLASLLTSVRPDVKILANYLLARIPEISPLIISVDPFGSKNAARKNMKSLKEAVKWVRDGGLLGVFPAGEVAHLNWKNREIVDPRWSDTIARLVRLTKAPVLPVYFGGRNSTIFQIMGLVHRRLRTVLLPHELLNKINREIPVKVGSLIPFKKLDRIENDADLVSYLRLRTFMLAKRVNETETNQFANGYLDSGQEIVPPLDDPLPLVNEIKNLPAERLLDESGEYRVYYARKHEIPHLMRELGRLREITFREAGEGTGKSIDLDRFDDYYIHLFVWNWHKNELVGAYRLGQTDEIINRFGLKGLYTRTLFKYKKHLLEQINPALELGRSFVRKEYQREYAPLHMLWRGLGQYVVRNPKYKILFGPVSINNNYQSASRQLLVRFLKANNFDDDLARLVKPKSPLKSKKPRRWHERASGRLVTDIDEVNSLIAEIETDQQGIPILLRHYLRLGGKLLGFNIDPDFSDVLDGLILVDLPQTPIRILERYLGKDGTKHFLDYHSRQPSRITT